MSIDHRLFLAASATRQDLRDVLVRANIGLGVVEDYTSVSGVTSSGAISRSTDVTIFDDLGWRGGHLDNGVIPNCLVTFQFRKENWAEYDMQTVRGIMALLNAYPEADAFLVAYDAEHPALLRIRGYLVLARQLTENNSIWDPAREPSLVAMVDLPYTIEPLGPWHFIQTPLGGPRTLSVVR